MQITDKARYNALMFAGWLMFAVALLIFSGELWDSELALSSFRHALKETQIFFFLGALFLTTASLNRRISELVEEQGDFRGHRIGDWQSRPDWCASTTRTFLVPYARINTLGFRLAMNYAETRANTETSKAKH